MDKLASGTEESANMIIKECYPDHTNTLARSGLSMKTFPTLKEFWDNADDRDKKRKEKHRKRRGGKQNAYF